jgi:hypothetical protein
VDGEPAHDMPLLRRDAATSDLWSRVQGRVDACVLPLVRRAFACPACTTSTALVRRYDAGGRTHIAAHRDTTSRVTLVVELRSAPPSQRPAGGSGLFISAEGGEPVFPALRAGDALLHSHELLHGVSVRCETAPCGRYSLVVWFHDDQAACAAGTAVGDPESTEASRCLAAGGTLAGAQASRRHPSDDTAGAAVVGSGSSLSELALLRWLAARALEAVARAFVASVVRILALEAFCDVIPCWRVDPSFSKPGREHRT